MSIQKSAEVFQQLKNTNDLAYLLNTSAFVINLHRLKPTYKVFSIPKNDGSFRLIEDPKKELKQLLRKINKHLQADYFFKRPKSVYGFCISSNTETERNIVNNAKQHIGKQFMLNIDLEDFFHSIKIQGVKRIFKKHFKNFNADLVEVLSNLCCYKNRLPMGAPTSPVLSNYAGLPLDKLLLEYTQYAGIHYTRYADDLCFSSQQEITKRDIETIRNIIQQCQFIINEQKVKYYKENDVKYVTGIVVKENGIDLKQGYLDQLSIEINRLKQTLLVEQRFKTGMSQKKLKLFKQEITGKWNFANMVIPNNEHVRQLKQELNEALNPPNTNDFESANWLDIPYL